MHRTRLCRLALVLPRHIRSSSLLTTPRVGIDRHFDASVFFRWLGRRQEEAHGALQEEDQRPGIPLVPPLKFRVQRLPLASLRCEVRGIHLHLQASQADRLKEVFATRLAETRRAARQVAVGEAVVQARPFRSEPASRWSGRRRADATLLKPVCQAGVKRPALPRDGGTCRLPVAKQALIYIYVYL